MTFRSEVRKTSCRRPSLCVINILPVAQVARLLSTQMLMWPVGVGLRFSYNSRGFFWIIHLFLTTYYFVKLISDVQIFLQYLLFFNFRKRNVFTYIDAFFVFPLKDAIPLGEIHSSTWLLCWRHHAISNWDLNGY